LALTFEDWWTVDRVWADIRGKEPNREGWYQIKPENYQKLRSLEVAASESEDVKEVLAHIIRKLENIRTIKRLGPDDPIPLDKYEKTNLSLALNQLRAAIHDEIREKAREVTSILVPWIPEYGPAVDAVILGKILFWKEVNNCLSKGFPEDVSWDELLEAGASKEVLKTAEEAHDAGIKQFGVLYSPLFEKYARGQTVGGRVEVISVSDFKGYGTLDIFRVPGDAEKLGDERLRFRLFTERPYDPRDVGEERSELLYLGYEALFEGNEDHIILKFRSTIQDLESRYWASKKRVGGEMIEAVFSEIVQDYEVQEKTREILIRLFRDYGCEMKKSSEPELEARPGLETFVEDLQQYFQDYPDLFKGLRTWKEVEEAWHEGNLVLECEKPVLEIIRGEIEKIEEAIIEDLTKYAKSEIDELAKTYERRIIRKTGDKLKEVSCEATAAHMDHTPWHMHIKCEAYLPTPATPDADLEKQDEDAVEVTRALFSLLEEDMFDLHREGAFPL